MSLRQHFEDRLRAFGPNLPNDFLLKYGRDYQIGPRTFVGPREEPQACYMNACHLALFNHGLTYVEGYVAVYGVPIQHAWCVDPDGIVVDPTIDNSDNRVKAYYGVPFITEYVHKAAKANGVYGLLDYYYSGKTAPKLYELGLEAGQQWLLSRPVRRRRARKVVA